MPLTPTQRAVRAAIEARHAADGTPLADCLAEYVGHLSIEDLDAVRRALDLAGGRWIIWSYEHLAWWAPNRWGYVANPGAAGRYNLTDAAEIVTNATFHQPINTIPNEVMVLAPEWMPEPDDPTVPDLLAYRLARATADLMTAHGFRGWDA
jgi:hypothetical protein